MIESKEPIDTQPIQELGGVTRIETLPVANGTRLQVTLAGSQERAARFSALAVRKEWRLVELRPQRQTLEDLFVQITGKEEPAAVS